MINTDYLKLRQKYPYLYVITFPDDTSVVIRPLTWGEYQSVITLQQLNNFEKIKTDIEDEIFVTCVIDCSYPDWKKNIDFLPAGLITSVANAVMMLSGSANPEDIFKSIAQARPYTQTIYSQIYLLLESFFKLTKDDINKMYFKDIAHHLAMSEQVISGAYPEPPFQLVKPSDKIDPDKENKEEFGE